MKQFKRLLYYLIINVFVSACTIFAVLIYWDQTHPAAESPLALSLAGTSSAPTTSAAGAVSSDPEPEPTRTAQPLTTYAVQPGDTLGEIALEFGVTVAELMELNGLDDPSKLGSGQILYVPYLPTAEPEVPAEPTGAPDEGIPDGEPPDGAGRVVISNVFGAGDLASERVRLERRGEGDVSLEGWQLRDQDGNVYTFPQLVLFANGAVDIFTSAGVNGVAALYWGLSAPAWSPGEQAELLDQFGNTQATLEVP